MTDENILKEPSIMFQDRKGLPAGMSPQNVIGKLKG